MKSIGTAVTSSYRDHRVQSGVVETFPILSIKWFSFKRRSQLHVCFISVGVSHRRRMIRYWRRIRC